MKEKWTVEYGNHMSAECDVKPFAYMDGDNKTVVWKKKGVYYRYEGDEPVVVKLNGKVIDIEVGEKYEGILPVDIDCAKQKGGEVKLSWEAWLLVIDLIFLLILYIGWR